MSPRPRKVSDEQVFAAAHRATNRLAPSELTLAEIAKEAGVTAGALAQRFGSKRLLLLALARGAADSTGGFIAELKTAHKSPLAAVLAYAECMAQLAQSVIEQCGDECTPEKFRDLLTTAASDIDTGGLTGKVGFTPDDHVFVDEVRYFVWDPQAGHGVPVAGIETAEAQRTKA